MEPADARNTLNNDDQGKQVEEDNTNVDHSKFSTQEMFSSSSSGTKSYRNSNREPTAMPKKASRNAMSQTDSQLSPYSSMGNLSLDLHFPDSLKICEQSKKKCMLLTRQKVMPSTQNMCKAKCSPGTKDRVVSYSQDDMRDAFQRLSELSFANNQCDHDAPHSAMYNEQDKSEFAIDEEINKQQSSSNPKPIYMLNSKDSETANDSEQIMSPNKPKINVDSLDADITNAEISNEQKSDGKIKGEIIEISNTPMAPKPNDIMISKEYDADVKQKDKVISYPSSIPTDKAVFQSLPAKSFDKNVPVSEIINLMVRHKDHEILKNDVDEEIDEQSDIAPETNGLTVSKEGEETHKKDQVVSYSHINAIDIFRSLAARSFDNNLPVASTSCADLKCNDQGKLEEDLDGEIDEQTTRNTTPKEKDLMLLKEYSEHVNEKGQVISYIPIDPVSFDSNLQFTGNTRAVTYNDQDMLKYDSDAEMDDQTNTTQKLNNMTLPKDNSDNDDESSICGSQNNSGDSFLSLAENCYKKSPLTADIPTEGTHDDPESEVELDEEINEQPTRSPKPIDLTLKMETKIADKKDHIFDYSLNDPSRDVFQSHVEYNQLDTNVASAAINKSQELENNTNEDINEQSTHMALPKEYSVKDASTQTEICMYLDLFEESCVCKNNRNTQKRSLQQALHQESAPTKQLKLSLPSPMAFIDNTQSEAIVPSDKKYEHEDIYADDEDNTQMYEEVVQPLEKRKYIDCDDNGKEIDEMRTQKIYIEKDVSDLFAQEKVEDDDIDEESDQEVPTYDVAQDQSAREGKIDQFVPKSNFYWKNEKVEIIEPVENQEMAENVDIDQHAKRPRCGLRLGLSKRAKPTNSLHGKQ